MSTFIVSEKFSSKKSCEDNWAHGSHSSHGSHSVHSNSDTHSNSLSSATLSTSNAAAHTATIGGVDWSGSFSNSTKLGVLGGSGSLSQLTNIVNSMRTRPTSTDYVDNTSLNTAGNGGSLPSSGTQITPTAVNNLLKYGGATFNARYQPFTLTLSVSSSGTSSSGPVSDTKTQDIGGNVNKTTTSWTSTAKGKAGKTTSYTYTDSLSGKVIKAATGVSGSFSAVQGSKITKEQAASILSALQDNTLTKWVGPASKSYTWSGYNNITHANTHSNHSSHSN